MPQPICGEWTVLAAAVFLFWAPSIAPPFEVCGLSVGPALSVFKHGFAIAPCDRLHALARLGTRGTGMHEYPQDDFRCRTAFRLGCEASITGWAWVFVLHVNPSRLLPLHQLFVVHARSRNEAPASC